MNIFEENDYRKVLHNLVRERKKFDSKINFQRLATEIRLAKSYLSKVMRGQADLNSDQMFLICDALELSEIQKRYLHLLLEYSRSSIKKRRENLLREIRKIQDEAMDSRKYIEVQTTAPSATAMQEYYLDPIHQIVHICLTAPQLASNLSRLCDALNITPKRMERIISKLEELNIIERRTGEISVIVDRLHLPKDSGLYKPWRNLLRNIAFQKMDQLDSKDAYSFSVVLSSTDEIRQQIKSKFLQLLQEVEPVVKEGNHEHVYQINFDLFEWA